jgi:hypothetical protein
VKEAKKDQSLKVLLPVFFFSKIAERPVNPEHNFCMSLGDDLMKIKSAKRREMVKKSMREILHSALMEEWDD